MRILSGDIGGTKTRIAILDVDANSVKTLRESNFASSAYTGLEGIVKEFLRGETSPPEWAGFGVAGPVRNGRCEATNLPWIIDSRGLERDLGLARVGLINDLEATAWGIPALSSDDLYSLHPGHPDPQGNLSVIAAGTGLGEAGICRINHRWHPFASEGGHADFAPANELEFALHRYLSERYGHVSWERVVSGPAIGDIFRFVCQYRGAQVPPWADPDVLSGDAGGAVSRGAAEGNCPLCEEAMGLFVELYGREAGNHALKIMATGGVYLGGGIAPKILSRLKGQRFIAAFLDKGRMGPLMRNMPVHVIMNDRAALYGAGRAAAAAIAS
jgi:glucokinase